MKNIIVTGAAGFIGTNLIAKLIATKNYNIIGIDNFSPYYDVEIKRDNVNSNMRYTYFECINIDITDIQKLEEAFKYAAYEFKDGGIDAVVHLAAQPGVSHSIENEINVNNVNINGFANMAKFANKYNVKHFVYASSSSVLGDCGKPKSPYAVTKATNELQADVYSNLYNMKFTGLRFFTVYGERMRPDLAIAKFTKAILNDEEIHVYGDGNVMRDFTYVGDVTEAIKTVIESDKKWKCSVFDVGRGETISIISLIEIIKSLAGKTDYDKVIFEDEKKYDAKLTIADEFQMKRFFNFMCKTSLIEGLKKYIEWAKDKYCKQIFTYEG